MAQGLWPDLAEWRGPTPNTGPAMTQQRGMVIHIAAGYYNGTINWQKNASADVSSHFVVAGPRDKPYGVPDGKIAQVVDCDVAAWTQRAGNGSWVSSENSGFLPDRLSAAQIESNAQLFARGHLEYGWKLQLAGNPNGYGLGYHSMGSNDGNCNWPGANWGHCECPGANIIAQLPLIVERAKQIVNGDDDVSVADVKQAMYELAQAVTNPTTPTDRNYRNDLYAAQQAGDGYSTDAGATPGGSSGALREQLNKIEATQALILARLDAISGGGGSVTFPAYTITGTATPVE